MITIDTDTKVNALMDALSVLSRELTGRDIIYRMRDADGNEVTEIGSGTIAQLTSVVEIAALTESRCPRCANLPPC